MRDVLGRLGIVLLVVVGSVEELLIPLQPRASLTDFYADEIAATPEFLALTGRFAWAPFLLGSLVEVAVGVLALALVWRAWHRPEARPLALFLAIAGVGFPTVLGVPLAADLFVQTAGAILATAALLRFSVVFPDPLEPEARGWPPPLLLRLLGTRPLLLGSGVSALMLALPALWDVPVARIGPGETRADHIWVSELTMFTAFLVLLAGTVVAALNLRASWVRGSGMQRRRVLWVLNGIYALLWVLAMLLPLAAAVALTSAFFSSERAGAVADVSTYTLYSAGLLLLPIFLAIAIFYDGAVDPRLSIRKTTVFGSMGMLTLTLFVGFEGVASVQLMAMFSLPDHLGPWLAGGGVALAFGPLRRWVERRTTVMVERLLPATALAEGSREDTTIVFADLCGYTRISASDEAAALTLASLFHASARRLAEQHGGRLVKTLGDGVVLAFPTAAAAAAAAVELRTRFRAAAEAMGFEPPDLRCGIHQGAVARSRDGDLFGAVVNLASRLESAAAPGEVLVSEAVAACLRQAPGWRLEPAGERELKNVPAPVATYRCRIAQPTEIPVGR